MPPKPQSIITTFSPSNIALNSRKSPFDKVHGAVSWRSKNIWYAFLKTGLSARNWARRNTLCQYFINLPFTSSSVVHSRSSVQKHACMQPKVFAADNAISSVMSLRSSPSIISIQIQLSSSFFKEPYRCGTLKSPFDK